MKKELFRFAHRLRVRWSEVDMQQIVFNAHYAMYLDTAICDYWRHLALPYEDTMAALKGDIFLKKTSIEFHASARYDDALDVYLRMAKLGRSSMCFEGAVFLGEQLLVQAELVYVFANPHTHTSLPLPEPLRRCLEGYELGQSMTLLRCGTWDQLQALAAPLRQAVFVNEQGIDPALEWDPADAQCVHAVLCNPLGVAVATGRLLPSTQGVAKIGRMAVLRRLRQTGLGKQVLWALVEQARQRGDREVQLHAQRSAQGFYQRLGFMAQGEPFEEAGISHIMMSMPL
ncbi:MAG: YbgC/FadM family acyl-CoA thioesterase [Betaproteobacteria bacterium]|nr:YbgC/FadM family acyl-CoA thioesterase [Betaproteobacteria bacterium]NBY04427.1 YbgC/FadM family acyl-CoA thioesterase [Betaproteobacteria bacterium]